MWTPLLSKPFMFSPVSISPAWAGMPQHGESIKAFKNTACQTLFFISLWAQGTTSSSSSNLYPAPPLVLSGAAAPGRGGADTGTDAEADVWVLGGAQWIQMPETPIRALVQDLFLLAIGSSSNASTVALECVFFGLSERLGCFWTRLSEQNGFYSVLLLQEVRQH